MLCYELVDVLSSTSTAATEHFEEVEEEYEVDNILDAVFEDDDEESTE